MNTGIIILIIINAALLMPLFIHGWSAGVVGLILALALDMHVLIFKAAAIYMQ